MIRGRVTAFAAWMAFVLGCGQDAMTFPADAPLADGSETQRDAPVAIDAVCLGPDADAEMPLFCRRDSACGLAPGFHIVPPMKDFIPLCDGVVILGDRVGNRVLVEDLMNNAAVLASYQLQSAPGRMDLDREAAVLYVAMPPATSLARIDLATGATTTFSLRQTLEAVAVGPNGKIFVASDGPSLLVLDGATGTVEGELPTSTILRTLLYDDVNGRLFAASDTALFRYSFNQTTNSVMLYDVNMFAGCNCDELSVAPAGDHLALACAGGNYCRGNVLYDFAPGNLSQTQGTWAVGGYPSGAAFPPDGAFVALGSADDYTVQTFSLENYTRMARYSTTGTCRIGAGGMALHFSRGGRVLFAYIDCAFKNDTPSISWFILP